MIKVFLYFMTFMSVSWLMRNCGHGYKQKYVYVEETAKRAYMVKLSRPSEKDMNISKNQTGYGSIPDLTLLFALERNALSWVV